MQMGRGELVAFASYRWRDEVVTIANNDPLGQLGSIQNLDATLTYIWGDDRYRVSAFGRNLTDARERVTTRIPGLTTWGSWNQGEHYGVELQVSF